MSVEKMEMLNIIGHLDDLDFISRELVLMECLHVVNAQHEINTNNFIISTTEKNMDALVDVCFIKPFRKGHEAGRAVELIDRMMEAFSLDYEVKRAHIERHFNMVDTIQAIEQLYDKVSHCLESIKRLEEQLCQCNETRHYFNYIRDIDIPWDVLQGMEYFYFRVGLFSKENMQKLKKNYENVPAIMFRVQALQSSDVVVSIAPKSLMVELDRIYSSLSYREIAVPMNLSGTPQTIISKLEEEGNLILEKIRGYKREIDQLKKDHGDLVQESYSKLRTYEKMLEINNETACSNDFFYMAGWIPVRAKAHLETRLQPVIDRTLLFFKTPEDVGKNMTPPSKLKNISLVRPFETMVTMYGIPSYDELDPTPFVGLSYMLMFGLMFGDVGQGLVLFLAGCLLSHRKPRSSLGGILARLGLSSMMMGALYGSVFGFENIIPALLIRPMDHINTILLFAVLFGIVILSISFVYNLINAFKRGDIEEGLLGRNGITGILFYWLLLITGYYYIAYQRAPLSPSLIVLLLGGLLALMVVKHPLANWLLKRRPLYHESALDYYIEGGFGILETLLSMLSNTISFVRIGAFALNHVGLFVAFLTMSRMMRSQSASILVLIIGNVVVIGLEGLIVFIQGLRLEYYEVFSKFFNGNGISYRPVALSYRRRINKRSAVNVR